MSTNDRSIGLSDLAARAQAGPQPRRQRSDCRNPECANGLTPGLVAAGGGSKAQPLFGAGGVGAKRLMRWSWIPCLACNKPTDAGKAGASYRDLQLSDTQIAQRAQLASTKASYQKPVQETLGRFVGGQAAPSAVATRAEAGQLAVLVEQNKQLNERLGKMLEQNVAMTDTLSRMSMQVAALLEDNAKMRKEVDDAKNAQKNPAP